jgi:hypothetical protein
MELNNSLQPLFAELTADPEGRGYGAMTPEQVVESLLAPIQTERTNLSSGEIYNAIVPADFVGLTDANRQYVRDILGLGSVDVSTGTNARSVLVSVFAGKPTLANLAASVQSSTSRAQQIGYSEVTTAMVERCREVM